MAKQAKRQLAGSGEALPAGVVGEEVTFTFTDIADSSGNTVWIKATPQTLGAGVWMLKCTGQACAVNGSFAAFTFLGIAVDSETTPTNDATNGGYSIPNSTFTTGLVASSWFAQKRVVSNGSTTIAPAVMGNIKSGSTPFWNAKSLIIKAVRIA